MGSAEVVRLLVIAVIFCGMTPGKEAIIKRMPAWQCVVFVFLSLCLSVSLPLCLSIPLSLGLAVSFVLLFSAVMNLWIYKNMYEMMKMCVYYTGGDWVDVCRERDDACAQRER